MSQQDLIFEYYLERPCKNIPHKEAVDWAAEEWEKRTGTKFRDPDRAVRKLHREGLLIKVQKGVYQYDPEVTENRKIEIFTAEQKRQIFERDGYKCALCGMGKAEGLELHIDHIRPKAKGEKAEIENGQVLCERHISFRKTHTQSESGKRMFMRLLRIAKSSNDQKMITFCEDVLKTYEKHDINGHIEWQND